METTEGKIIKRMKEKGNNIFRGETNREREVKFAPFATIFLLTNFFFLI